MADVHKIWHESHATGATIYFYIFSISEQYQDDCETEVTLSQWFKNVVKNRITFD